MLQQNCEEKRVVDCLRLALALGLHTHLKGTLGLSTQLVVIVKAEMR
jgi:hypothetical protein